MPWPFQISDLAINDQTWTAVITPFACNSVAVKNSLNDAISIKTDEAVDTLAAGGQETVMSYYAGASDPMGRRFKLGATVMQLKATSGSGTVKVRFLF